MTSPGPTQFLQPGTPFAERREIGFSPPPLQHGGLAHGLALVGEGGVELADFRRPARIYSNEDLRAAIAGGGKGDITLNVNVAAGVDEGMVRQIVVDDLLPLLRGPGLWRGSLTLALAGKPTDAQTKRATRFVVQLEGGVNTSDVPLNQPTLATAPSSVTVSSIDSEGGLTLSETLTVEAGTAHANLLDCVRSCDS